MKTKIWCLGLSRTGTSTFTEVLKKVGKNHIHYPTDYDMFHGDNDGCGDIPVIPVYKELDKLYPNSKFVYTVRDKDAWMNSMGPYLERKREWKQGERQVNIRKQVYGDPFFDEKLYSDAYDRHDEDVRNHFKNRPYDFLVLDIVGGDATSKLFDFLEIKLYPKEFPHYNKLVDGKGVQVK